MLIGVNYTGGANSGIHEIIRLFFPQCRVTYEPTDNDLQIDLKLTEGPCYLEIVGELQGILEAEEKIQIASSDAVETRREVRRFVYCLLKKATGKTPSPYGILTGVRPTKLVHRCLDKGSSADEIQKYLEERFFAKPEKASLLIEVALRNRSFLLNQEEVKKYIAIYIGIPYCPSRCHYCSFPGHSLEYQPGLEEFFRGLLYELSQIGQVIKKLDLMVDTIYVGGGTPTVLDGSQWDELLGIVKQYFLGSETTEFTVEAGRPDTLNSEILYRLMAGGVNRICVNPQTMNDETLIRIGRQHTVQMTREAFELARRVGFKNINMDLIIGLPGEGPQEFRNSLKEVIQLQPEGITVHYLSRKRGSTWEMQGMNIEQIANSMEEDFQELLKAAGYVPYYLYRQKYMAGNQENMGFALPSSFGKYNIRVIDERQTIVGLGGGAASKFINPLNWTLTTMHHPKDPATYLKSLDRLITAQVDKLIALS